MSKRSLPVILTAILTATLTATLTAASAWPGFAAAAETSAPLAGSKHVVGIGGVFFKADDPQQVGAWYRRHFGIEVSDAGFAYFLWRDQADPAIERRTVWSVFPRAAEYFGDSGQQFMINYIVLDLNGFLRQLAANGVTQVGGIEEYDYGRFAWVVDSEGNRVELWEPTAP